MTNVSLVSCVGVKSGTELLIHFLDYYESLDVDRFLIILHTPRGDDRNPVFREILKSRDITPVEEIPIYSARIKMTRSKRVVEKYCSANDWVLYADLDEFQLYPKQLKNVLDECENANYDFVRGRLVDRIAPNGKLKKIYSKPSLWEQFPYKAYCTANIMGGWDHKVCVAKSKIKFSDGGNHAIDYGYSEQKNYEISHNKINTYPDLIEIHHFKWDSTLMQRVKEKLSRAGGDLDSVHGNSFIKEYLRLKQHIEQYGYVQTTDAEFIGIPPQLKK